MREHDEPEPEPEARVEDGDEDEVGGWEVLCFGPYETPVESAYVFERYDNEL